MLRTHNTIDINCWCNPRVEQWDGNAWVPYFDPSKSSVVVHNSIPTYPPNATIVWIDERNGTRIFGCARCRGRHLLNEPCPREHN